MSHRTSATSLHVSTAPPFPISKDFQGSDNPIPLSPQWLLPKPGEGKPGGGTVESHVISTPSLSNRTEAVKTSGNGEDVGEEHKRKDVFRPSVLDSESGRHDRWRDEERDTKSSIRQERWRDGDKVLGDARRVERWADSSSARNFGETRRSASDRWSDSGNREMNFDQRREKNRWTSRWGHDEKEPEVLHEKKNDSGKDCDLHLDKDSSHISNPGKDEKEGERFSPWRSNSLQRRGRIEPSHNQNVTPSKQVPIFSSGRGRGEDTLPGANHGRGRGEDILPGANLGRGRFGSGGSPLNSSYMHSQYPQTVLDKVERERGETHPFRYSRTNILDVYRVTDVHTAIKLVDDFAQVPPFTQDKPLGPLALCAPTSEELTVLKGIDKGEIVSSSAPPVPKDGRNSTEFTRQMKLGNAAVQDRGEDGGSYKVADEVHSNIESAFEENSPVHPGTARRTTSQGEQASSLIHDSKNVPGDVSSKNSDMKWSHQPKDFRSHWENSSDNISDTRDVAKWQSSGESIVKRPLTGYLDGELESRRVPQTSPEELSLFYKDPRGQVQGPFKGVDIIGWLEAGYFGIDLLVRLESAAADSPWLQLVDVMPHLRAKARPPPGFPVTKLDTTEAPVRQNTSPFVNIHTGPSEVERLRNNSMHRLGSATEAENRFLESLMSGSKSSPTLENVTFSEGIQGFIGNNSGNLGPSGVDGVNNPYLMAQRMALERQRSLPNPYPYWPGIDAASLPPKADVVPDASPHSKLMSSLSDNSRQFQSQSSVIQGLSDRASTGLNNSVAGWSNYPQQAGLNPLQNNIDLRRDQNFIPFGIQQQTFQAPNHLSLNDLRAQTADNPSNILAAEKLFSSSLSQDPQIVNMLQQQYLLQMHSQATAPAQQMPLLDKLLYLKQQEEQQLLMHQQQQMLSHMLQGHQSHQNFGGLSYGQLQGGGIRMGNLHVEPSQRQPPHENFHMSSQIPVLSVHDELSTKEPSQRQPPHENFHMSSQIPVLSVHDELSTKSLNLSQQESQDTSYIKSTEFVQLPHQFFGNSSQLKSQDTALPEQINEKHQEETLPASASVESFLLHEQSRTTEESNIAQKPFSASDCTVKYVEQMADGRADGTLVNAISESGEHSKPALCVEPVIVVSSAASPLADQAGKDVSSAASPLADQVGTDVEVKPDEHLGGRVVSNVEPSVADVRDIEVREPKKATEKKSKKQKSSKSQSSGQVKGLLKNVTLQKSKNSESEKLNYSEINLKEVNREEDYEAHLKQTSGEDSVSKTTITSAVHQEVSNLPANITESITETYVENDSNSYSPVASHNTELSAGRAWKPAPGFKAKSLLEIQQEEHKKAQTEMPVIEAAPTTANPLSVTTPWVGVAANPDPIKVSSQNHKEAGNTENLGKTKTSQHSKSKKSPLHDLLAEDVEIFNERDGTGLDSILFSQYIAAHSEPIDEGEFIEAKDTRRSRKKSTKSKGSGSKISKPVASSETPISSSPIEKGKSSRSVQQEKELPAIPSGPSLGDFVLWREEPTSPSPSPAWTIDSGRVHKPLSLRDILKEQEKKSSAVPPNQFPTQKSQPAQTAQSSGPSRTISAPTSLKAASSSHINFEASHSKYKGDDDMFWGSVEQSKQETKQSNFSQLASQVSRGSKDVPMKGNSSGSLSHQKSGSSKPTERLLSSSPISSQSLLKLKKDVMTRNSEAMDFRVWCENECVRLIGTKDTSFLEFCSKQSKSEAEMFLKENLGSYDPDHEFIDKFLDYMELLPSEVLETAFLAQNDRKVAASVLSGNTNLQNLGQADGSPSKGGKKGKKGKKVSAEVLGFNVVSSRIMMGEIQTVED